MVSLNPIANSPNRQAALDITGTIEHVPYRVRLCGGSIRSALICPLRSFLANNLVATTLSWLDLVPSEARVTSASIGGWRVL